MDNLPHLIPMLVGEYFYLIDQKGRLAIPPRFREHLGKDAVVARGLDKCLWLHPRKEWEAFAEKLIRLPIPQANTRAFVRLMMASAHHVEIDSQGRILIPEALRSYASLSKRVAVIGLYNRIEIWDSESWANYQSRIEQDSGDIAEKLGELGLSI